MQLILQIGSTYSFGDELSNFRQFIRIAWFKSTGIVKNKADICWVYDLLLDVMFSMLDHEHIQLG